jgi:urease accessory protein
MRIARAASSTIEEIGSATVMSDVASLRHEALHSRVFRS